MNWTKLIKEVDYYNTITQQTIYTNQKNIDIDNYITKVVTKKTNLPDNALSIIEFFNDEFDEVTTKILNESDTVVILAKMSLIYKFNNIYRANVLNSLKLIISMPFEYTDEDKLTHNYYYYIFKVKQTTTK